MARHRAHPEVGGKPGRAAGVTPGEVLGLGLGRPCPLPLVEARLSRRSEELVPWRHLP